MNSEEIAVKSLTGEYSSKAGSYFQVQRREMLTYVPTDASFILDVGCADGSFGQLIKTTTGAEVWGVEPNKTAASVAAQKVDKVVNEVFTEDLELPEKAFDCIIFNDVLEHLVDPNAALLYSKKLLKDNGKIIASIPNVRYFDNIWNLLIHKNWEYTNWGILDETHLRFFTHKSILSTFRKLNYEVTLIEGINPLKNVHPHHLKRFKLLNLLLSNKIEDMQYLQFAVVAQSKA